MINTIKNSCSSFSKNSDFSLKVKEGDIIHQSKANWRFNDNIV